MTNTYQITRKKYLSWGMENNFKGARLVLLILWCVFAILFGILDFIAEGFIFYKLMIIFCLYRAFFRNIVIADAQYRRLTKVFHADNWTRTITFGKEDILFVEGTSKISFLYTDISNIYEKENKIRIDFSNKTVIRLYRDAFSDCTWEECRRRIEEKRIKE